jgi:hypothetical protein
LRPHLLAASLPSQVSVLKRGCSRAAGMRGTGFAEMRSRPSRSESPVGHDTFASTLSQLSASLPTYASLQSSLRGSASTGTLQQTALGGSQVLSLSRKHYNQRRVGSAQYGRRVPSGGLSNLSSAYNINSLQYLSGSGTTAANARRPAPAPFPSAGQHPRAVPRARALKFMTCATIPYLTINGTNKIAVVMSSASAFKGRCSSK